MNKKQLGQYKEILLDKRMELQTVLKKKSEMEKSGTSDESMDSVDQANSNYRTDFNLKRREMVIQQVKEIDEALERINSGEFGDCDNCGEQIPKGRLEVRPNARFCTLCKDEMEKRGAV